MSTQHSKRLKLGFSLALFALFSAPAAAVIPASERNALIALYNSTNGGVKWTGRGWMGLAGTECQWQGVTCNDTKTTITELGVGPRSEYGYPSGLNGSIPPELGQLTSLTFLYIAGYDISGSIPPELGKLTQLMSLLLPYNQLSGDIPSELGNLS